MASTLAGLVTLISASAGGEPDRTDDVFDLVLVDQPFRRGLARRRRRAASAGLVAIDRHHAAAGFKAESKPTSWS